MSSLVALPVISILAVVITILPCAWHYRVRNTSVLILTAWFTLVNFIYFINSIVWHDNVEIRTPIWCDITTKLIVGANIAIPATSACLLRNLSSIATASVVNTSRRDRQRKLVVDLAFGVLVPIIYMILHLVIQDRRFNIIEGIGCMPVVWPSWLSLLHTSLLPFIFAMIAAYYSFKTFRAFYSHRETFRDLMKMNKHGLTRNRFFRLIGLAVVMYILTIAAAIAQVVVNLQANHGQLLPYKGWDQVHTHFSLIYQIRLSELNKHQLGVNVASWLVPIVAAIIFFIFFGFAEEAVKEYIKWLCFCMPFLKPKFRQSSPKANESYSNISYPPSPKMGDYEKYNMNTTRSKGYVGDYELPVLRA